MTHEEFKKEVRKREAEIIRLQTDLRKFGNSYAIEMCPFAVGQVVTANGGKKYLVDNIEWSGHVVENFWVLKTSKIKKDGTVGDFRVSVWPIDNPQVVE